MSGRGIFVARFVKTVFAPFGQRTTNRAGGTGNRWVMNERSRDEGSPLSCHVAVLVAEVLQWLDVDILDTAILAFLVP